MNQQPKTIQDVIVTVCIELQPEQIKLLINLMACYLLKIDCFENNKNSFYFISFKIMNKI